MNDEAHFLDALRADPTDVTVLLVYADWLEERGDPRAEYIRLLQSPKGKAAQIQKMREQLDPTWLTLIEEVHEIIAAKMVQAELVEIDQRWRVERERYRIQAGSRTPATLPDREFTVERCVGGLISLAFGIAIMVRGYLFPGPGDYFFYVFGLFLGFVGGHISITTFITYRRYQRAFRAYWERRARVADPLQDIHPR